MDIKEGRKHILLFGTGRSGSTVFMEALFRHPELAYFSTLLEKKPNWQALNLFRYLFDNTIYRTFGVKQQLNQTSILNRVVFKPSEAYPIWNMLCKEEVSFGRDFLYGKEASKHLKNEIIEYVNDVKKYQHKDKFAFKITGPSRLTFINSVFPGSKFIWLKRDFIPTLSSFLKVGFWQNRSTAQLWWKGPYSSQELEIVEEIKNDAVLLTAFQLDKIIRITEEEIRSLGIDVLHIEYEQFVQQPEELLKIALDYCNLSHHKDCLNYMNNNKIINRNKSNENYFDSNTLSKLEKLLNRSFSNDG